MEDSQIVQLFWDRDPRAVEAAAAQYGGYCTAVARNILGSAEDAEECVNDAWLAAWNSIPPHRPVLLSTFLGKLTRNIALNRLKRDRADKRGRGDASLALDELAEVVSDRDTVETELARRALLAAIDAWLGGLPAKKRGLFVCRYWYFDTVADIAARYGMRENHVSVTLNRLRADLRKYLRERGFEG